MGRLFTIDTLPTTSAEAIRVFDERYLAAQGVVQPDSWAETYGDFSPVSSPKITFPISQVSGKYLPTTGDSQFKTMLETSFDIKVSEFDMGYEAKLLDLFTEIYAYRKWKDVPTLFNVAEMNHRVDGVAAMLELGTSTAIWDGSNFFATNHKANIFDKGSKTFSNYQATPKDPASVDDIAGEITAMRGILDENGKKMNVNPDTILLPTEKFEYVKNKLKQAMIANSAGTASMDNPYLNGLTPVCCPQLTDADDFYLLDSKLIKQLPAWSILKYTPPGSLGLRTFDESTDFFRETGKIKVSSHIWYGFGLVFPHGIRLVRGK